MVEKEKNGRNFRYKCSCGHVQDTFVPNPYDKKHIYVLCENCKKYTKIKKFWHRTQKKKVKSKKLVESISREIDLFFEENNISIPKLIPHPSDLADNSNETRNTMSEHNIVELKNNDKELNSNDYQDMNRGNKRSEKKNWDFLNWNYNIKNRPIIKKQHSRSYNDAIKNAAYYLINEILTEDFKKKYKIIDGQAPLVKTLRLDRYDFVRVFQNRGLKYYHIIEEAGFELQDERQKVGLWDDLNWTESGNPRTYIEAIQNAAYYFLINIYTDEFIERNNLTEGIAPTAMIMYEDKDSKSFYNAYRRKGLYHNDIMRKADLELNKDDLKWEFIDWDESGIPRTYSNAIKSAGIYLTHEVLTEQYKRKNKLNFKEAPTIEMLDEDHKDFISAIGYRRLNYNDILRNIGYEVRHDIGKWKFLNWSKSGFPRSYSEAIKNGAKYLASYVMTTALKNKYHIPLGKAPDLSILERGNNDFVITCQKRNLHFRDIFKTAGYKPIPRNNLNYFYPHPKVERLGLSTQFPNLIRHLRKVVIDKGFPDYILENLHKYPRISSFKGKLAWIRPIERKTEFVEQLIRRNRIKFVSLSNRRNAYNNQLLKLVSNLIKLSQDKHYDNKDFYSSHGSAGHEYVLPFILEHISYSSGIEIPVWICKNTYLTGHIDLIVILHDIIIVADYKPDENPFPQTHQTVNSFLNSIPQVASYGLILKELFNIKKLLCVTFNKSGSWIYEPEILLEEIDYFIVQNKIKDIEDRPWKDFFN